VSVGGQTTQFVYDGDGNLVKKIKPDGSRTIYIGNVYEVDKTSGGAVSRTVTYYPAGGAMRINSTVYYVLKDRLGSAYATTDASGNTVGEMRYYASGEMRLSTGSMFTDRLFTGQREIARLGLYHYGARFYSPKLGRFISADSIVPGVSNPQALNRYSYALNNPIKYNDPSGHGVDCGIGMGCVSDYISPTTSSTSTTTTTTTRTTTTTTQSGGGDDWWADDGGSDGGGTSTPTSTSTPTPDYQPPNPIDSYCGDISGLACAANATQDIATLIDLVGVVLIEAPLVIGGCLGGGPLGCALGEFEAWGVWNTTLNNAETIASGLSFVFTFGDDLLNNGGWGENSATSLTTLIAGQLPLSPSWDLAVDTYASGYNHGFFNGIYTFGSNGLLKP
jgi:RHS repeat-associated protein